MLRIYSMLAGFLLLASTVMANTESAQLAEHSHAGFGKNEVFEIFNFVAFCVLIVVLSRKSLKQFLYERRVKIEHGMKESAALYAQAQADISSAQQKTQQLPATLSTLRSNLQAEAEAERTRLTESAKQLSLRLQKEAELQITVEKKMAEQLLQKRLVQAAQEIATKTVQQNIRPAEQDRFVTDFIKDIPLTTESKEVV